MKNSKLKTLRHKNRRIRLGRKNSKLIKIGLGGCGTIGSEIARAIETRFKDTAKLIAICDCDEKKTAALRARGKTRPSVVDCNALIKKSDLIIEAASAKISGEIAAKALAAKKDVMVMSVGGIMNKYASLRNLAKKNKCTMYVPSGAICGLDGVKAAHLGTIHKAELVTRKPPHSLAGAPFLAKNNIDVEAIRSETVIFEGTAEEAIEGFPANINVSCALSLAGIGPKKTRVTIIASPGYTRNVHEISVEGACGKIFTRTENVPSPHNPKTSYLAVLSALATLRQILEPVKVGT